MIPPGRTFKTTHFSTPSTNPDLGLSTYYFYNSKGQQTLVASESWGVDSSSKVTFVSLTTYDVLDRVEWQTDSFAVTNFDETFNNFGGVFEPAEGVAVLATRTEYDPLTDQAIGTSRFKGTEIAYDHLNGITALEVGGELRYQTSQDYDIDRVVSSVDRVGQITSFEFDELGRQDAQISPFVDVVVDGEVQRIRHRTESIYDERGQLKTSRDGIAQDVEGNVDDSDAPRNRLLL